MTNAMNDNDYVRKSKDGTELDSAVGKELCLTFNINYKPEVGDEMKVPKLFGQEKTHFPLHLTNLIYKLQKEGLDSQSIKSASISKVH